MIVFVTVYNSIWLKNRPVFSDVFGIWSLDSKCTQMKGRGGGVDDEKVSNQTGWRKIRFWIFNAQYENIFRTSTKYSDFFSSSQILLHKVEMKNDLKRTWEWYLKCPTTFVATSAFIFWRSKAEKFLQIASWGSQETCQNVFLRKQLKQLTQPQPKSSCQNKKMRDNLRDEWTWNNVSFNTGHSLFIIFFSARANYCITWTKLENLFHIHLRNLYLHRVVTFIYPEGAKVKFFPIYFCILALTKRFRKNRDPFVRASIRD